jgi:hypothetical protein
MSRAQDLGHTDPQPPGQTELLTPLRNVYLASLTPTNQRLLPHGRHGPQPRARPFNEQRYIRTGNLFKRKVSEEDNKKEDALP